LVSERISAGGTGYAADVSSQSRPQRAEHTDRRWQEREHGANLAPRVGSASARSAPRNPLSAVDAITCRPRWSAPRLLRLANRSGSADQIRHPSRPPVTRSIAVHACL